MLKRKKTEEYYKYQQSVCSDACDKGASVKDDERPTGTTVIIDDSVLNGKVEEKLSLVNEKLPQCKVWLSTPTLRTDNGKATLTVPQLVNHLLILILIDTM